MTPQLTPRLSSRPVRFPNRIREYRLKAGLSQKALGNLIGKARNRVSAWERGRSLPTVPNLLRLAKALNTLGEALYEGFYCSLPRESVQEPAA